MHTEFYDMLGVSPEASPEEIKKAFRRKAIECHPDKHAGDKDKEMEFKKINEAYSVLSDAEKRQMYDQFGQVPDGGGHPGQGGVDINDLFNNIFAAGGPGMMGGPGGFSFMFMDQEPIPDIFRDKQRRVQPCDLIDIGVDICDLYYGKTKKVEFEMLDQCSKCNGTGAADPAFVVKCLTCGGKGSMMQQVGPFFAHMVQCNSCAGSGSTIKNNKVCQTCKGSKTVYNKRAFELKIPKGIQNGHETRMENKGAFDERLGRNKDMVFRFKYDIKHPYELDPEGNVTLHHTLSLEEVLAGFEKTITIYNDEHTLKSDHYFNPSKEIVVDDLGIFNTRRNKHMKLKIKFDVKYNDNERMIKYNDVLRKICNQKKQEPSSPNNKNQRIINLTPSP